jgi:hypothetical protein
MVINYDLIERNKTTIVNFGLIILAIVIALQFYNSTNVQIEALDQQQKNELEKNKVIQDIAAIEKKTEIYKKIFVKKDLGSVMDIISGIAKSTSVKIISIKPYGDETVDNYLKSSFLITLNAPSYHALGDFISKIENSNEIYLISEINIGTSGASQDENKIDLGVNLKINTMSYL